MHLENYKLLCMDEVQNERRIVVRIVVKDVSRGQLEQRLVK